MIYFVRTLLLSLAVTLAVELVTAKLLFRLRNQELSVVALVNIMTNPPFVLLLLILRVFCGKALLDIIHILCEILIILAEGFLYKRHLNRCRHPFILSLTANLLSIAAGLLF